MRHLRHRLDQLQREESRLAPGASAEATAGRRVFAEGLGPVLTDLDGNQYLDFAADALSQYVPAPWTPWPGCCLNTSAPTPSSPPARTSSRPPCASSRRPHNRDATASAPRGTASTARPWAHGCSSTGTSGTSRSRATASSATRPTATAAYSALSTRRAECDAPHWCGGTSSTSRTPRPSSSSPCWARPACCSSPTRCSPAAGAPAPSWRVNSSVWNLIWWPCRRAWQTASPSPCSPGATTCCTLRRRQHRARTPPRAPAIYEVQDHWADIGTVERSHRAHPALANVRCGGLPVDRMPWRVRSGVRRGRVADSLGVRSSWVPRDLVNEGQMERSVLFPGVRVGAGARRTGPSSMCHWHRPKEH